MIPRINGYNPTDMLTDPYFNEAIYVGRGGFYKGNGNYQCVNYAIGRSCEIAQKPICYFSGITTKSQIEKPMMNRSGYGNAINWWNDTLWQKGSEPRLGAVMVYGSSYGGGYGHVRVVEQIENGRIFYSGANESRRLAFKWIDMPTVSQSGFLGYIYNPFTETDSEAIISQLRTELQQAEELLVRANTKINTYSMLIEEIRSLVNENGGL